MTAVDIPATLLVPALEDSGAQTLNRYAWQASMAVIDLFALAIAEWGVDPGAHFAVVCEHHEDYVVIASTGTTLVSVKHRERTRGGWTLAALVADGGLAHLFDRWRSLDTSFGCRLVTCINTAASGNKFSDLHSAVRGGVPLDGDLRDTLKAFATKLASSCNASQAELDSWLDVTGAPTDALLNVCVEFLSAFQLDASRSDRDDLRYSAIAKYAAPFVEALDIALEHAPSMWTRCNDQLLSRMQGQGAVAHGGIRQVVDLYRGDMTQADSLAEALQSRVFSSDDLRELLDLCVSLQLESTLVEDLPAPTVLSAKVINGGLTLTTAHLAEDVAQAWRMFESSAEHGGPGALTQVSSLRAWVQSRASEASEEATASGTVDGRMMWGRLQQLLKDVPEEIASPAVTPQVLLGAACVLASECKVWFSPAFSIEDAVSRFPMRLDGTAA